MDEAATAARDRDAETCGVNSWVETLQVAARVRRLGGLLTVKLELGLSRPHTVQAPP